MIKLYNNSKNSNSSNNNLNNFSHKYILRVSLDSKINLFITLHQINLKFRIIKASLLLTKNLIVICNKKKSNK